MQTVYDRMFGDSSAKNSVNTLYIPINVWFWPTLAMAKIVISVALEVTRWSRPAKQKSCICVVKSHENGHTGKDTGGNS
jgi:hypothetical protein